MILRDLFGIRGHRLILLDKYIDPLLAHTFDQQKSLSFISLQTSSAT